MNFIEKVRERYPEIDTNELISCECPCFYEEFLNAPYICDKYPRILPCQECWSREWKPEYAERLANKNG